MAGQHGADLHEEEGERMMVPTNIDAESLTESLWGSWPPID